MAHYGVFKGLKLGMREKMDEVDENLQKITQVVDALAKEQIASLAGDAAEEKKKQWSEVVLALADSRTGTSRKSTTSIA